MSSELDEIDPIQRSVVRFWSEFQKHEIYLAQYSRVGEHSHIAS